MIKFINSASIVLLIATGILLWFVYHDEMDVNIPYINEIVWAITAVFGLMLLLKMNVRWQGVWMALRVEGFPLSIVGFGKVILSELISVSYFLIMAIIIFRFVEGFMQLSIVFLLLFLEGVFHLLFQVIKKPYKVFLNDKNVTVVTNKFLFVRWSDIEKIVTRHQDVHFITKLKHPVIVDTQLMQPNDRATFIHMVEKFAREKNIYCSVGELLI
jgi:hypothetical protein